MPRISVKTLHSVLGGELLGSFSPETVFFSSVSIDSRTITDASETCFFALKGERNNGHRYLPDLARKGVRIFVVSEVPDAALVSDKLLFVKVENTLDALQQLAAWNRSQCACPVVGITGSNGKTIVKEWLFDLLQAERSIVRNPRSYNSQVGVPLSVWLMDQQHDLALFEAGISRCGEMARLAKIVQPTIGIFTTIGEAHQENFSSLEEKINEKLNLFESATAILFCADQLPVLQKIKQRFPDKELLGWSFSNTSSPIFVQKEMQATGTMLQTSYEGKTVRYFLPLKDDASVENAAHCLVFLVTQHLCSAKTEQAFADLQPVPMRLEMKEGINNCKIINDYYNSDINSLAIALNFQEQQNVLSAKQKTLILSDIMQSGQSASELYREVNHLINAGRIDRLIGIGPEISRNRNCFSVPSAFFSNTDTFLGVFEPEMFREEMILLKGAREFHFERISSALQKKYHQTVLEINLNRLVENLNMFRAKLQPETKMVVMVKAFSYGSGTTEIARVLQFHQVDYLAVAVADEGIELRRSGIDLPIIVMNPEEHSFESMIEFRLEPNIYSLPLFERFERALKRAAADRYPIHVKLETGMNRLGFSSEESLQKLVHAVAGSSYVVVASVFSHLAVADEPEQDAFTLQQIERFKKLSSIVVNGVNYKVLRHLLNSAGIERFSEYQFEMVRLGIGLYGISSGHLLPVRLIGTLKTTVSQVKKVTAGETIGYGRRGKALVDSEIAVLPIGYADGYDRRLGNGVGKVYVRGQFAPIIGNICMDMCMINVTGLGVQEGDEVEIMGDHVNLNDIAESMRTIPYEVLTSISQRVKRVYVQE